MLNHASIKKVRLFNRFYTRQIGLLQEGLLNSPFSLAESRVIYELAQQDHSTASRLGAELGLDAGYLSRILKKLDKEGLIERSPSTEDARQTLLALTDPGKEAFSMLNTRSDQEVEAMLRHLTASEQERLTQAMETLQRLLKAPANRKPSYLIRMQQAGDMGWIVYRHGVLYAQEYGWDATFEALVAEIVAGFIQNFDPIWEQCWIAEVNGETAGSVFLVKQSEEIAKLRLLYVEPEARGMGIGSRLVDECIQAARRRGYRKITLWTNSVLTAARKIYDNAGFHRIAAEPNHSFGKDLISETWELEL